MKVEINCSKPTTVVITKDEHNFTEVLESFCDSSRIAISTYNISTSDNSLLNKIIDSHPSMSIIILNIPGRFENYTTGKARLKARNVINSYCNLVSALNFNLNLRILFNFKNHAKIIVTDNLAYIGSANYSSESKDNFECGVVFNDVDICSQIYEKLFMAIASSSIDYTPTAKIRFFTKKYQEFTEIYQNLTAELHDSLYTLIDHPSGYKEIFDYEKDDITCELIEKLDEVNEQLSEYADQFKYLQDDEMCKLINDLNQSADMLGDLSQPDGPIYIAASFDIMKFKENYISDNAVYINEDNIDDYDKKAQDMALEKLKTLMTKAYKYFQKYESLTSQVQIVAENIITRLFILKPRDEFIDNT